MAFVYQHIRLDTKEVFYIGIGKNRRRLTSKDSRNKHWKNIVNKAGFKVEIIKDNISWAEACELEINLINITDGLCNILKGGEGAYGYKHTDDFKLKMSKVHKGIPRTKETKNKISKSSIGKQMSKEAKIKMSLSHKGKKFSKEHIKKLRKQVIQLDINDNIINTHDSLSIAGNKLNISPGHISKVCKGKRKTCGGFKWKYK